MTRLGFIFISILASTAGMATHIEKGRPEEDPIDRLVKFQNSSPSHLNNFKAVKGVVTSEPVSKPSNPEEAKAFFELAKLAAAQTSASKRVECSWSAPLAKRGIPNGKYVLTVEPTDNYKGKSDFFLRFTIDPPFKGATQSALITYLPSTKPGGREALVVKKEGGAETYDYLFAGFLDDHISLVKKSNPKSAEFTFKKTKDGQTLMEIKCQPIALP